MKIIITESKSDRLIERLLKENGINLEMEIRDSRSTFDGDTVVYFWFRHKKGDRVRGVRYQVENGSVYTPEIFPVFSNFIPEFKYIPNKVIYNYFGKKGKEFLELHIK